jgi:hypothetical protein
MCATSLWKSCRGLAVRHGVSLKVLRVPSLRREIDVEEEKRLVFFWTGRDSDAGKDQSKKEHVDMAGHSFRSVFGSNTLTSAAVIKARLGRRK